MRPQVGVKVVLVGPQRRVFLRGGQLPSLGLPAAKDFAAVAHQCVKGVEGLIGLQLLGIYSDPLLFQTDREHVFWVAFIGASLSVIAGQWSGEGELPKDIHPGDLRIIYDAMGFSGTAFVR